MWWEWEDEDIQDLILAIILTFFIVLFGWIRASNKPNDANNYTNSEQVTSEQVTMENSQYVEDVSASINAGQPSMQTSIGISDIINGLFQEQPQENINQQIQNNAKENEAESIMDDGGKSMEERTEKALEIAWQYGQIDGCHHKTWVIDQMVRALCESEEEYLAWVESYETPMTNGERYEWDIGIAP